MSSEIRAGDNRTYWIISNGNGYVDGVTDPNLVTTVGNGWHIYWIGSDYNEYLNTCNSIGILPRNTDPSVPTTIPLPNSRLSARQVRLWLVNRGIDLNNIDTLIDAIEDPIVKNTVKVEWEYAPYVEIGHPWILNLANQLGLSEFDVQTAFIEAKDL